MDIYLSVSHVNYKGENLKLSWKNEIEGKAENIITCIIIIVISEGIITLCM